MYDPLFKCEATDVRHQVLAAPTGQVNKEWWNSLPRGEQIKYLKDHPESIYKRLGVKQPNDRAVQNQGPTTIEQTQNQKLGNQPADHKVKQLNQNLDEKLKRITQSPQLQKALAPRSPERTRSAQSLRDNRSQIVEQFKKQVPPEGISKTADTLRTLADLPPETPMQSLRNSVLTGGAALLARHAFMNYAVPAMGLAPTMGLTLGVGLASVVLFGAARMMLKNQTQKSNVKKIEREEQRFRANASLITWAFEVAAATVEHDDGQTVKNMSDDEVLHGFLNVLADTMENANMPMSYWARGFDLEGDQ